MARRARKGSKKKGKQNLMPVFIGIGAIVVLALILGSGVLKKGSAARGLEPTPNFRIAEYRQDGSRFASSGNVYVFDGRVENIETVGNARLVSISIPDNPDERLPLLVPGDVKLRVNLTRGDRVIFETTGRTGKMGDGKQVKGVLIVKNVETK